MTSRRIVACPTNVTTFTVGGLVRRRCRYSPTGHGELPSGPTAMVVMPCETCETAVGSTSTPDDE